MSEDLPSTNKAPKQQCFLLESARLSIQPPLGFFFLNGTIARFLLLALCLLGPAEKVVSRRRSDNLMDVC